MVLFEKEFIHREKGTSRALSLSLLLNKKKKSLFFSLVQTFMGRARSLLTRQRRKRKSKKKDRF